MAVCPYKTLGVDRDAKQSEIKDAYRKLVLKYHPDRYVKATERDKAHAKQKFQNISEAFETIGSRSSRQRHDFSAQRYARGAGGYNSSHYTSGFQRPGGGPYSARPRANVLLSFISSLGKVSMHEVLVMFGVVSVVLVGTNATDSVFTSLWNRNNQGKLYKDIQSKAAKSRKDTRKEDRAA